MDIPYTLNPRLVRGLDYYTKTTFEFWPAKAGSQSSLGGGGRYDGLAEAIGGRPTPGIGVALGLERVILELKAQQTAVPPVPGPSACLVAVGEEAREAGIRLLAGLRAAGVRATMVFGQRSLKAQMKQAGSLGARHVLILGPDEVQAGTVTVRDMVTSSQVTVSRDLARQALG
jgi:histidyl-tRNA synthetase